MKTHFEKVTGAHLGIIFNWLSAQHYGVLGQWFKELVGDENYLMFTAESGIQEILGFIIGKLIPAPEVIVDEMV